MSVLPDFLIPTAQDMDDDIAYVQKKIDACYAEMGHTPRADLATREIKRYLVALKESRRLAFPQPTRFQRSYPI